MPSALIVDDDTKHLRILADLFREHGFTTEVRQDMIGARDALSSRMPDVALLKERIGESGALELLSELDLSSVMEVYLMSGQRSLDAATRAMRLGVTDYFTIPVDHPRLVANLRKLARDILSESGHDHAGKSGRGLLVGESLPMRRLYRTIRKIAPSSATILVMGESGCGKELVAQTIHRLSGRASGEFLAINCGAIPRDLMESELFGHKRGSFSGATRDHRGFFEQANRGTLFLDEITEMDLALQVKLLRALEDEHVRPVGSERDVVVNPRIIAATNQDPREAIAGGALREDLYFRLAQFSIRVPSLRERGDDIDSLSQYFLDEQNEERGVVKSLGADACEALRLHDWPGNVRELKNAILHGHLLAGETITLADLPDGIPSTSPGRAFMRSQMGQSLAEVERRHLLATLAHCHGDKKRCADVLGISLKTLYNRLKKYDVS